ncbi:MAG: signal peptidase I [Kiritimatiellia bacterium]
MAKKTFQDYGREWLDTLVVAISVAMAFRAYFYEPFKIPTGSMQETLWGYHTTPGVERSVWDRFPLSLAKWAWTGERVVDWAAPATGTVRCADRRDGFATVSVGLSPKTFSLPTDACRRLHGQFVREGETLWKGAITTGDFIFVNRWKWNFVKPQNGEVMIFSTTGIDRLPQGTHYIKRMKARPGETYVLEHPPADAEGRPIAGLPSRVTMGPGEYFACGDNYANSFDSRYWGPVPAENLRGCASFVFWPFNGWRVIR